MAGAWHLQLSTVCCTKRTSHTSLDRGSFTTKRHTVAYGEFGVLSLLPLALLTRVVVLRLALRTTLDLVGKARAAMVTQCRSLRGLACQLANMAHTPQWYPEQTRLDFARAMEWLKTPVVEPYHDWQSWCGESATKPLPAWCGGASHAGVLEGAPTQAALTDVVPILLDSGDTTTPLHLVDGNHRCVAMLVLDELRGSTLCEAPHVEAACRAVNATALRLPVLLQLQPRAALAGLEQHLGHPPPRPAKLWCSQAELDGSDTCEVERAVYRNL